MGLLIVLVTKMTPLLKSLLFLVFTAMNPARYLHQARDTKAQWCKLHQYLKIQQTIYPTTKKLSLLTKATQSKARSSRTSQVSSSAFPNRTPRGSRLSTSPNQCTRRQAPLLHMTFLILIHSEMSDERERANSALQRNLLG